MYVQHSALDCLTYLSARVDGFLFDLQTSMFDPQTSMIDSTGDKFVEYFFKLLTEHCINRQSPIFFTLLKKQS